MARRISRAIHPWVAALLVIGLLVQIFLAGMGIFAGRASFATHRDVGFTLQVLPFILILTSVLGGFGRRHAIPATVMFIQFFLQSILLLWRDDLPAIAALHPVNGVLILVVAAWLAWDAWRLRDGTARESAPV